MKTIRLSLTITAFITLFFMSVSYAQMGPMWHGSHGWGMGGRYCGMFNNNTIETISGEVISVDRFIPMMGMSEGVRITVKTVKETIPVHLGPEWYIQNQDFKVNKGDVVTVTGSRIIFDGKPAIIAMEVKKGNLMLKLWNERGNPHWSGCCGW